MTKVNYDMTMVNYDMAMRILHDAFYAVPYYEIRARRILAGAMWYVFDMFHGRS